MTKSNIKTSGSLVIYNLRLIIFVLFLVASFLSACSASATANNELTAENKARNADALRRAQKNIKQFRQGDADIKVIDKNGKPVAAAQINIKQISHDFKFGCYLKIDDLAPEKLPEYERQFAKLFNFAVIGTYWDFVENKQGEENWFWFEREVRLARKLNLISEAAPILWGTNKAGTPAWLPRRKDELLSVLKRHIESVLTKYGYAADDWEIVNEPLAPKTDFFARGGREYIEAAFSQARKTSSSKRLMINEYGVFGALGAHNYNRDRYFELLQELIKKDAAFDVVGIQAHASGEWFEPANVAEQLDRYATLGKPIQITEFSAQTLNYDDRKTPLNISGDYQTGVWTAEKQAEFYREFYTIAFGNPQVEAIVQWGLDDERAWLPGIGLFDENGNRKPNYETLDRLINEEWRTNLQINSLANGNTRFRGFYGVYEVEVVSDGKWTKTKFNLKKSGKNEWILRV